MLIVLAASVCAPAAAQAPVPLPDPEPAPATSETPRTAATGPAPDAAPSSKAASAARRSTAPVKHTAAVVTRTQAPTPADAATPPPARTATALVASARGTRGANTGRATPRRHHPAAKRDRSRRSSRTGAVTMHETSAPAFSTAADTLSRAADRGPDMQLALAGGALLAFAVASIGVLILTAHLERYRPGG
jgi:hypothetical protein